MPTIPTEPPDKSVTIKALTEQLNRRQKGSGYEFTGFLVDATDKNQLEYTEPDSLSGLGPLYVEVITSAPDTAEKAKRKKLGQAYQFEGRLHIEGSLQRVAAYRIDEAIAGDLKPIEIQSSFIQQFVSIAEKEWQFFGKKELPGHANLGMDEKENDASERIKDYWEQGLGITGRTGKTKIAWSAAFICYVMRKAGLSRTNFPFSAAHRTYITSAIKGKGTNMDLAFWGHQLGEHKPEVGDMVCSYYPNDETNANGAVTYDVALKGQREYPSHCDIVVAKTENEIVVIGGNVSGSVTKKHFKLEGGLLKPENFKNGFAVLGFRFEDAPTYTPTPAAAVSGAPFSKDTNLKTTKSPLTADDIRAFFVGRPEGKDNLKDIADPVMAAAAKYDINASYIVAHAILESGWGLSKIAKTKKNLFGWAAFDSDTSQAKTFETRAECIDFVMGRVDVLYLKPDGEYFRQAPVTGDKSHGMNVKYASDAEWGAKIAQIARKIESSVHRDNQVIAAETGRDTDVA